MKKSRFQKAREEKELKKKLDDEEAAKVYDSFVASFTEDEQNGKTFVRGGNILESNNRGASESTKTEIIPGRSGEVYKLQTKIPVGADIDDLKV
mmetsp:Transcript_31562/g.45443  ORF Transcript_31562/g.45443 Transcript_31562/m.45443 type:complete len:94 (+) Transcript_31562:278-559(+)